MPFTFAHPAAVLPLRRRFKSLQTVPLIVGSVAPDLPYFIPARLNRVMLETHTFSGSFWVDIPIGMLVLLFGFLLRRPLVALLTPRARALCLQGVEHFKERHVGRHVLNLVADEGAWRVRAQLSPNPEGEIHGYL